MEYVLVSLETNWADEFDVVSHWVAEKEEALDAIDIITNSHISEHDEFCFGTNEGISFESAQELMDCISIHPITEEFYKNFVRLIGEETGLISVQEIANRIRESESELDEDYFFDDDEDE